MGTISALRRPAVCLLAAAVTLGALSTISVADPSDRKREVENSLDSIRESLGRTSAELQNAYQVLNAAQTRLPQAKAELASAEAKRAESQRVDAELALKLTLAKQSEQEQTQAVASAKADLRRMERQLGRLGNQAYRSGGVPLQWELTLGSGSATEDPGERLQRIEAAMRVQEGPVQSIQQKTMVANHQLAQLEVIRKEIASLKEQAARNLEIAKGAERDAAQRKAEIEGIVAQQTAATQVITARKHEEEAQIAALERENAALEQQLAQISKGRGNGGNAGDDDGPPPAGGGIFSYPVNGRITSVYGWRIHPIYHTRRMHTGTDFGAGCGTPIRAAASGTIVRTGWAGGYGNQIVIDHGTISGRDLATSYNHMSAYGTRSGRVSRGQVIGYVGTTGASTGCHLHFEVFVNSRRTDPMPYL